MDVKTDRELDEYYYNLKLSKALLAYMGDEASIRIFLEGLNSTDVYIDMDDPGQDNEVAVLYNILGAYQGIVGSDTILTSHFYEQQFLYVEDESELGEPYQEYLSALEGYFKEKHVVEANIRAPFLIKGQQYFITHD